MSTGVLILFTISFCVSSLVAMVWLGARQAFLFTHNLTMTQVAKRTNANIAAGKPELNERHHEHHSSHPYCSPFDRGSWYANWQEMTGYRGSAQGVGGAVSFALWLLSPTWSEIYDMVMCRV